MKIAVHGSYFGRNFGDTLLIKIVCDWIKELGNHEIILPLVSSKKEANEIGARKADYYDWSDIDVVVFAGGGYFGEPNSSYLRRQLWYYRNWKRHLQWYSKINPQKTIILGVGFGPIKNLFFRKMVFSLFNKSDMIYLRDQESIDYAKKYGYKKQNLFLGVDLAFFLGINCQKHLNNKPEKTKIGLHLPFSNNELSKDYSIILDFLYDYKDLEVICDSPRKNLKFTSDIYFNIEKGERKIKIVPYKGCADLINQINNYKAIITSKLHVGIVATNMGIPVYSVPKHSKTIRYYKQINYESNCNPLYRFDIDKHRHIIANFRNLHKAIIPSHCYETLIKMKNEFLKLLINYS